MPVIGGIEVDAVDLVDDLAHEGAVLHVVVGILEGGADKSRELVPCPTRELLELGAAEYCSRSRATLHR